jgi:hypothetical protein
MARTPLTGIKRTAAPANASPPRTALPTSGDAATASDAQRRQALIAEAAYYRAVERGFAPGAEVDDWLAAEREVNNRLLSTR